MIITGEIENCLPFGEARRIIYNMMKEHNFTNFNIPEFEQEIHIDKNHIICRYKVIIND